jgi:glycosyltransferase involved in cell wall biosynthesis
MSAVKVLYLITELNVGGAERVVQRLATQLSKHRYDVLVACLYDPGAVADEITAAGVPVVNLGMRGKRDLRVVWRLFRLLRDERIQILHSHLFHANLLAVPIGRVSKTPVIIVTRHNSDIYGARRELVNRSLRGLCDAIVVVSGKVREVELQRAATDPSKIIVIPNGVHVEAFSEANLAKLDTLRQAWRIQSNAPVIGTVASFQEYKGHAVLIDATVQILEQFPHTKVLLVGDGPLRSQMENKVNALALSDTIIFTGVRQDVRDILPLLDLFVLPSLSEGLPVSILEAMAASRPVVATYVGGVPEAVVDRVTGLLVPPGDPTALVQAIVHLLDDPDLRQQMGQAGRERVLQHFTVERMVERTQDLYEELLAEKGLRSG